MVTPDDQPTDDPASDGRLRKRTIRGMGWNLFGVVVQIVLQAVVLMVLARLVTPEEFGLVAAALIVVNLLSLVAAAGLGPALVQLRGLTDLHVRVAVTVFALLGIGLWGLVTWQASGIAGLFAMPDLAPVLPLLGSVLVLRNLTVGDWLLQRRLAFRTLAVLELQSYAVGFGLVAVGLAVGGAGVGAIVAGHVAQAAVRTLLVLRRAPHPARPALRWAPLRDLLRYGGGHVLGRLLQRLSVQGDNLVVARLLGPVALGLYGRAYQLMVLPSELVGGATNRVLFPSLAAVQDDRGRLAHGYRTGSAALAVVTVPLALAAGLVAPELVRVLLGEDWLALVPAFQVMAAGIVLRTVSKVGDALVQATGRVYRHAARHGVHAALVIAGAWLGSGWGITGVAAAILVALAAHAVQMTHLALRCTGLAWRSFLDAHVPALLTGAAAAVALVPVMLGLRTADAPALVVLAAAGTVLVATGLAAVRIAPAVPALALVAGLTTDLLASTDGRVHRVTARLVGPRHDPPTSTPHGKEPSHADHETTQHPDGAGDASPAPAGSHR